MDTRANEKDSAAAKPAGATANSRLTNRQLEDESEQGRRPSSLARRRLQRVLLWVTVIAAVVVLSLLVTAWISGFRYDNGFPDVFRMIAFIIENTGFFK